MTEDDQYLALLREHHAAQRAELAALRELDAAERERDTAMEALHQAHLEFIAVAEGRV